MKNIVHKQTKKHPLVSVVMPVYNGADYLEGAIKSVLASTYHNYELILVDDGSKDNSRDICAAIAKKNKKIRFFPLKKNIGLPRALNFALSKAHGKYICRLNQDDMMFENRISTQVKFLETHRDVVLVGSWIRLLHVEENSSWHETIRFLEKDKDIKRYWLILSPFSDPSVMYRKDIALKAGGYDPDYFIAEDTHMWMRMGKLGKLANIPKPLVEVRFHENATTVSQFKRLTLTTYRLHRYVHNHIEKAPLWVQLFWIGQLVTGLILPPKVIFSIYRRIKKTINSTQAAHAAAALHLKTITKSAQAYIRKVRHELRVIDPFVRLNLGK